MARQKRSTIELVDYECVTAQPMTDEAAETRRTFILDEVRYALIDTVSSLDEEALIGVAFHGESLDFDALEEPPEALEAWGVVDDWPDELDDVEEENERRAELAQAHQDDACDRAMCPFYHA